MFKPSLIAIVDDDMAVRQALSEMLQLAGIHARLFDSAAAFLASDAIADADLVISDVRMPGVGGLELQRRLRARAPGVPLIFITSIEDEVLHARALAEGAAGWFIKPVAQQALLAAICQALDGRSA